MREGHPVEEILHASQDLRAELIMMPTRGLAGHNRAAHVLPR
jgi:hypothetical protein